ncbi:hypothetical protein AB2762_05375 [Acinetobacter indicus]
MTYLFPWHGLVFITDGFILTAAWAGKYPQFYNNVLHLWNNNRAYRRFYENKLNFKARQSGWSIIPALGLDQLLGFLPV